MMTEFSFLGETKPNIFA